MDVNEFFDLIRARHSLRSEVQLAEALGIPPTQLVQYRQKRRPLDADISWTMAELLGKPPAEVIAVASFAAETDQAKRERGRKRLVTMGVITEN